MIYIYIRRTKLTQLVPSPNRFWSGLLSKETDTCLRRCRQPRQCAEIWVTAEASISALGVGVDQRAIERPAQYIGSKKFSVRISFSDELFLFSFNLGWV